MLILLSPAKTISEGSTDKLEMSTPIYEKEARQLAFEMSGKDPKDLSLELGISPELALEVHRTYMEYGEAPLMSAIHAYDGIVYKYLKPAELSPNVYQRLCDRVRMTSFLYGYLRPRDGIRPYRMEGKVRTQLNEGGTMFAFWRDRLTNTLIHDAQERGGRLLYLASEEMKKLFDWKRVEREVEIFYPSFKVRRGNGLKQIVVYTKMMRGMMCRTALEQDWKGTDEEMSAFGAEIDAQVKVESKAHTFTYILG